MNVLLETTFKLFVVEKFPPKFIAYAMIVFVPTTSGNVAVQFVQTLVVFAILQFPLFNLYQTFDIPQLVSLAVPVTYAKALVKC